MKSNEHCSQDGLVLLLLCSKMGLHSAEGEQVSPLTSAEWRRLARQIGSSALECPGALLGLPASRIATDLEILPAIAERLTRLLDRAPKLTDEFDLLRADGIWVVTLLDDGYPSRIQEQLGGRAPLVLFGAGNLTLPCRPAVAVVGSRQIDPAGAVFAAEVGRRVAAAGWVLCSGGARGADKLAMDASLRGGGGTVGVLADGFMQAARAAENQSWLLENRLTFITPYPPHDPFRPGGALGRNKIIYALSQFAVVISCEAGQGGTWTGATEALKQDWCPVFVRNDARVPAGNDELLKLGALSLSNDDFLAAENLPAHLQKKAYRGPPQTDLFGMPMGKRP
jgi:predicted Rossmann fold nucleotide-binding protein DprA/Smf involved in DNA uptake